MFMTRVSPLRKILGHAPDLKKRQVGVDRPKLGAQQRSNSRGGRPAARQDADAQLRLVTIGKVDDRIRIDLLNTPLPNRWRKSDDRQPGSGRFGGIGGEADPLPDRVGVWEMHRREPLVDDHVDLSPPPRR